MQQGFKPIPQETLDNFVQQTYHWKSLPTHLVMNMAIELNYYRTLVKNNKAPSPCNGGSAEWKEVWHERYGCEDE